MRTFELNLSGAMLTIGDAPEIAVSTGVMRVLFPDPEPLPFDLQYPAVRGPLSFGCQLPRVLTLEGRFESGGALDLVRDLTVPHGDCFDGELHLGAHVEPVTVRFNDKDSRFTLFTKTPLQG